MAKETKEVQENKVNLNETNNILQKLFIVLIIIACLLAINTIIVLVKDNISTSNSNGNEEETINYDVSMFTEIKASDIAKQTKGKARVIYIGRSTCSWCAKILPYLQQAQSEIKYKTLYIDIAKIIDFSTNTVTDQDSIDLITSLNTTDDLKTYMDENFGATPMVIIVKDSKIIAAQTGYVEFATLKSFLNENGFK